jgi:polyvinyl alcohol dehydrogenase (cytochrome)
MASSGNSVFVPVSDAEDGRPHENPPTPGLFSLDLRSGAFLWKAPDTNETCRKLPLCSAGISAAITTTGDLIFAGASDGWLRAYDAQDGHVLWHFDMTQSVATVDGSNDASGGSMGGAVSPIAYHGMLIVPSGLGFGNAMPGNVLFVFETKNGND